MASASLRPSRPNKSHGPAYRIGWFFGRLIVWFLALSIGFTVLYKFVPVPLTITMIADPNGFAKDWTPLSEIDRNMVGAAIGGEDGKFCTHDGFDREAIEQAIERNQTSKRLRGGSTISQQTAKNVFLWQGTGWSRYPRKGLEAYFTLLIETVWGVASPIEDDRTIDAHMRHLREKIEDDPSEPKWLLTVRGIGYKFKV